MQGRGEEWEKGREGKGEREEEEKERGKREGKGDSPYHHTIGGGLV